MATEKPFLWYYGDGSEPEMYRGGFKTRDEAVSEGQAECGDEVFSIVEAQKGSFSLSDASDFFEWQLERWSDDDMGADDGPEFRGKPEVVKAAMAEFDALLGAWAERHAAILPEPWAFDDTRNEETFNLDKEEV